MTFDKYYVKPIDESIEECIATYGDNFHQTLDEARKFFSENYHDLGTCVVVKVTYDVIESLLTPEQRREREEVNYIKRKLWNDL